MPNTTRQKQNCPRPSRGTSTRHDHSQADSFDICMIKRRADTPFNGRQLSARSKGYRHSILASAKALSYISGVTLKSPYSRSRDSAISHSLRKISRCSWVSESTMASQQCCRSSLLVFSASDLTLTNDRTLNVDALSHRLMIWPTRRTMKPVTSDGLPLELSSRPS